MTEWEAAWLYAPVEEWSPEEQIKAHKEILKEIEQRLKWERNPDKIAQLDEEADWRREEINRLKEQMKRTA